MPVANKNSLCLSQTDIAVSAVLRDGNLKSCSGSKLDSSLQRLIQPGEFLLSSQGYKSGTGLAQVDGRRLLRALRFGIRTSRCDRLPYRPIYAAISSSSESSPM